MSNEDRLRDALDRIKDEITSAMHGDWIDESLAEEIIMIADEALEVGL